MYSFGDTPPDLAAMFTGVARTGSLANLRTILSVIPIGRRIWRGNARRLQASGSRGPRSHRCRTCGWWPKPSTRPSGVEARREIAETLGPSMLTPDEWEARLTARNMEREKLNQLGPQGPPPHTRG